MGNNICPNYKECSLVTNGNLPINENRWDYYMSRYCKCVNDNWNSCKRFRTKEEINFCPDFVMPDSKMTIDEIIDRFDEE